MRNSDQALDEQVRGAAEVPRHAPQDAAQHEAHGDADQTHRQGDTARVQQPREQVASQLVGAEQKNHPRPVHPEQVQVGLEQAPQAVAVTPGEQPHRVAHRAVLAVQPPQAGHVDGAGNAVHERPRVKAAVGVDEVQPLGLSVKVLGKALEGAVRREELAEQAHAVEQRQHHGAADGQPVTLELEPHQPPLGRRLVLGGVPRDAPYHCS